MKKNLTGRTSRDYDVRDFGAAGDGKTNDTEAFTYAMECLAKVEGPKKLIASGRFVIDLNTLWNVTDNTTLDWTQAVFMPATTDTKAVHMTIKGRRNGTLEKVDDTPETTTYLTADAVRGSVYVDVERPGGIEEGDLLVFISNEVFQKEAQPGKAGYKRKTQEPARVSSVVGNRVYLDAPLLCDYTAAGHQADGGTGYPSVQLYKTAQNVTILGGTWEIYERCSRALVINEINLGTFRGLRFVNPLRRGMEIRYCSGDTHYDQVLERHGEDPSTDSDATPSFGYGVMHTYCCYSRVFGGQGRRGWHCFDATQAQRDITYYNFVGQMDSQSISSHADCILFRVVGCQIEGRHAIHGRARYVYVENCRINGVEHGAGVEWGADSFELHIYNSTFEGSWGNAYPINGTIGQRPNHPTVRNNSKAIIKGNTFSGIGGNISLIRGAKKIIFEDNTIESDDFATTVSKLSFYLFAGGKGFFNRNTLVDIVGGGRSNISLSAETGTKWIAKGNIVEGDNKHGVVGDVFSITGDDAAEVIIEDNTVDTELVRYFINCSVQRDFKSISRNTFMASNTDAIMLRQTGGKDSTVDRLTNNNVSSASNRKTQAFSGNTITISKDINNIYSDT